jgi:hypothetical protein
MNRSTLLPTLVVLVLLPACSDKGAVKDQAPPAQAEAAQPAPAQSAPAPPLVSGRGDAGAQLPPGHPPIDAASGGGAPSLQPPPAGSGTGASALAWDLPKGWVEEKPDSQMRRAQYRVPGPGGDAQCAVFYFGPGQGGDPMSNAKRWAGQFELPGGGSAERTMKTSNAKVGELSILTVEVHGTYKGGMTMTAEPAKAVPGSMLLGAVAEGPDANWFFKLTGPEATVQAQRASFDSLVKSLKRGA